MAQKKTWIATRNAILEKAYSSPFAKQNKYKDYVYYEDKERLRKEWRTKQQDSPYEIDQLAFSQGTALKRFPPDKKQVRLMHSQKSSEKTYEPKRTQAKKPNSDPETAAANETRE